MLSCPFSCRCLSESERIGCQPLKRCLSAHLVEQVPISRPGFPGRARDRAGARAACPAWHRKGRRACACATSWSAQRRRREIGARRRRSIGRGRQDPSAAGGSRRRRRGSETAATASSATDRRHAPARRDRRSDRRPDARHAGAAARGSGRSAVARKRRSDPEGDTSLSDVTAKLTKLEGR